MGLLFKYLNLISKSLGFSIFISYSQNLPNSDDNVFMWIGKESSQVIYISYHISPICSFRNVIIPLNYPVLNGRYNISNFLDVLACNLQCEFPLKPSPYITTSNIKSLFSGFNSSISTITGFLI
jgi:hypothetical protein